MTPAAGGGADARAVGFPFAPVGGRLRTAPVDDTLHGRIVQVLFTEPGERVGLPEFGCGLYRLVFEPDDELLGAALGFGVREALTRWLGEEILVDGVEISRDGTEVCVAVAFTRRADLAQEGLRLRLREGVTWTTA